MPTSIVHRRTTRRGQRWFKSRPLANLSRGFAPRFSTSSPTSRIGTTPPSANTSTPAARLRRPRTRRSAAHPARDRSLLTRLRAAARFRSKPCAWARTLLPATSIPCRCCSTKSSSNTFPNTASASPMKSANGASGLKREAEKELAEFYPKDADGATPIAYLWARTIQCEGPGCGAEVPLFRSTCLSQGKASVHLKLKCDQQKKTVNFELVTGLRPSEELAGVLRRSSATCPKCGYTTPATNVRNQFKGRQGGAADAKLLAVVTNEKGESGRRFRLPVAQDERATKRAMIELREMRESTPDDVPDETLPYLRSIFNIHLLDVTKWSYLFTPRQLVSLLKLTRLIRKLGGEIRKQTKDGQIARGGRHLFSIVCRSSGCTIQQFSWWQPNGEFVAGTFGRQALGIVWDFAEIRPVGGASGDLDGAIDWVVRVIESNSAGFDSEATVEMASATKHPLPDDSAAAVVTDPPYYDAVPYADLSDYFYVFLKRMLKGTHPTLFNENLTPKKWRSCSVS